MKSLIKLSRLNLLTLICLSSMQAYCQLLNCGSFDVHAKAGLSPIIWKNPGDVSGFNPPPTLPTIIRALELPSFHSFYTIPWIIGGEIGYAYSDALRLFLDFDYVRAEAKSSNKTRFPVLPSADPSGTTILNFKVSNYRMFDASIGAQYYIKERHGDPLSLFVGAKVGLNWHNNVTLSLSEDIGTPTFLLDLIPASQNKKIFLNALSPLVGLQIGVNYEIAESWSFALTGEFIATRGPNVANSIPLTPSFPIPTTHILIDNIRAELHFPITASIKYIF